MQHDQKARLIVSGHQTARVPGPPSELTTTISMNSS